MLMSTSLRRCGRVIDELPSSVASTALSGKRVGCFLPCESELLKSYIMYMITIGFAGSLVLCLLRDSGLP